MQNKWTPIYPEYFFFLKEEVDEYPPYISLDEYTRLIEGNG
jgi:hypothetical protein